MTKVTVHYPYQPDVIVSKDAFESNVGKELPLTNQATGEVGVAKVLAVGIDDTGITMTYETNMNFGMRLDNVSIVEEDLQIVVPLELPDE